MFANIGIAKIWENIKQKFLGVLIDRDLKFNEYFSTQCRKADWELSALVRMGKFMTLE